MWPVIFVIAVVAFVVWLVRTPLVRAHLRGRGKDPGDAGTRVDGKFPRNGGSYYFDGKER